MHCPKQSRQRVFAACLCLLAVALLFAPFAGAAWASRAMDCCTADHCTIPEHHHRKTPVHADCDHNGLTACSMSCCQDQERPFATAMLFVMPPLGFVSASVHIARMVDAPRSGEVPRSIQPLLQPPRISSFAV
jgi:hypothetical protein